MKFVGDPNFPIEKDFIGRYADDYFKKRRRNSRKQSTNKNLNCVHMHFPLFQ